jgi:hypothetical protein
VDVDAPHPELRPSDERAALVGHLDWYRGVVAAALRGLDWEDASTRHLVHTDLTIAGIVRHLAWVEDRWFQGRLVGTPMPPPWDGPGADDPDHSMRLAPGDTVESVLDLYAAACGRSRAAEQGCESLDQIAAVASSGGPKNLRWILVHMLEETARHAGHLDLLGDCIRS